MSTKENDVTVNNEVSEESTELMVAEDFNTDYNESNDNAKIGLAFIAGGAIGAAIKTIGSRLWKKHKNRVIKKAEQYKEEYDDEVIEEK